MEIILPDKVQPLLNQELMRDIRYVILYGGRGSGKSHSIAQILIILAAQTKLRILCVREFQSSIRESCHKLLCDYIEKFQLNFFFDTTNNRIVGANGSEFIFTGIRQNPQSVKSLEGIDICWIEEAQTLSKESLELLIPTIRKIGSQLWFSMNPKDRNDPVYQMIENPPPKSLMIEMNYSDNPFCPYVLIEEAEYQKGIDFELYRHIWLGKVLEISESIIFRGKYEIQECLPESHEQLNFGLDFGFSEDPMAFTRSWIRDECLYIDYAEIEQHIELDKYPDILDNVPQSRRWPIYADAANPGNISLIRRQGFNIQPAKKWSGSIDDGISHLKAYKKIIIHPRCKKLIEEFSNYSWKVNRQTDEILPIPEDKYNHGIDSLRYALHKTILADKLSIKQWKTFLGVE